MLKTCKPDHVKWMCSSSEAKRSPRQRNRHTSHEDLDHDRKARKFSKNLWSGKSYYLARCLLDVCSESAIEFPNWPEDILAHTLITGWHVVCKSQRRALCNYIFWRASIVWNTFKSNGPPAVRDSNARDEYSLCTLTHREHINCIMSSTEASLWRFERLNLQSRSFVDFLTRLLKPSIIPANSKDAWSRITTISTMLHIDSSIVVLTNSSTVRCTNTFAIRLKVLLTVKTDGVRPSIIFIRMYRCRCEQMMRTLIFLLRFELFLDNIA